jgi:hypothetical protein
MSDTKKTPENKTENTFESKTRNTQENETESDASAYFSKLLTDDRILHEIIRYLFKSPNIKPSDQEVHSVILQKLAGKYDEASIRKAMKDVQNELSTEEWKRKKRDRITFVFSITKEPITPQKIALAFTALTELYTRLWLISQHRSSDAIAYTPSHVHLADEAGAKIAWATYNSPFLFGLQLDDLFPKAANAFMTIADGLSQRKAKREKLEIENMAAKQKIREAEEQLKQKQAMAPLELEKMEIENEKLRITVMKERLEMEEQPLLALRTHMKNGNVDHYAIQAIKIASPQTNQEVIYILAPTITNSTNQFDRAGLTLVLPEKSNVETPTKENTEQ